MNRVFPVLALLIPLGCRGEFNLSQYANAETVADAESESESQSEADGESESESEGDTDTDTGTDTDTETETDTGTETETGTDTETDTDTTCIIGDDGCFGLRQVLETGANATDLAVGHFAGSPDMDLLVAGDNVYFFAGSPSGEFGAPTQLAFGGRALAIGHIDDDPVPDLAAITSAVARLQIAGGGGAFDAVGVVNIGGWDGLFADLDNDGDDDLVISGQQVAVALSNNGDFDPPMTFPYPSEGLSLADIDDDGALDLAITSMVTGRVHLLRNDGVGTFAEAAQAPLAGAYDLALVDLDGQDIPELLVVDTNAGDVKRFALSETFSITLQETHTVGDGPRRIGVGDIDGDGRPDVVTPNRLSQDLSILLNVDGALAAELRPPSEFTAADQLEGLAVADLDDDGRAEILVTALGSNRVFVFGYLD